MFSRSFRLYHCHRLIFQNGVSCFNVTCQLIPLVAVRERKKANSAFYRTLNHCFRVLYLSLSTFLSVSWGLVSALRTSFQLSALPRTVSTEPASNDHNNKKRRDIRASSLGYDDDYGKLFSLHFCSK